MGKALPAFCGGDSFVGDALEIPQLAASFFGFFDGFPNDQIGSMDFPAFRKRAGQEVVGCLSGDKNQTTSGGILVLVNRYIDTKNVFTERSDEVVVMEIRESPEVLEFV